MSVFPDLLCGQCELLPGAASLCPAGVRVRDARAGAPHLHLQPHHHPRPLKVPHSEDTVHSGQVWGLRWTKVQEAIFWTYCVVKRCFKANLIYFSQIFHF